MNAKGTKVCEAVNNVVLGCKCGSTGPGVYEDGW